MFAKDFCSISDVQIGRFRTPTLISDSISLNTDLFSEVEEILAFIRKSIAVEFVITGNAQREEQYNYPLEAIREIVLNMIVHRDYRDSSNSIVKIFDNKIEFYNPGKLYGDITIEKLVANNYISRARNKTIARAFKEIGFIEQYGSGIMRIRKMCEDYGCPQPQFEEVNGGFKLTIFSKLSSEKSSEKGSEKSSEKTADILINLLKSNPKLTIAELSFETKLSTRAVEKQIKKLREENKITRIGPDKGGYWTVNDNKR